MYTKIITVDGDHELMDSPTKREMATIAVESNVDGATITLGYKGSDGLFHSYQDGALVDTDTRVNCGEGVRLMARASGISTSLTLNVFSYGA